MIIKNAIIYKDNGKFEVGDILLSQDQIQDVRFDTGNNNFNFTQEQAQENVLEAEGLYVIPGLTDVHFHGCAGYDFCDGTPEALKAITEYEAFHGVTTICPATMTLPEEQIADICKNAAGYENSRGAILAGIHMEGPYLSEKKKGAQNAAYLHKPDIEMYHRLQEVSGKLFRIVSIAPEEDGAMQFIEKLKDEVVISLAHTNANYQISNEAFQKGASHVTHLYNAMPPLHHRDPAVIGAAFDNKQVSVEIICDGIHLHPSVIRATFQLFGEDRVILVSDSMMATGLEDGSYSLGGQDVKVTGKKATLQDGTIAGSATNLLDCMKYAVKECGIPLETAVKTVAVNPAKKIGIYENYGSITEGKAANLVLLDRDLNVKHVILRGAVIR
ncbi:MAG: N-acetylglucosamine-6-phosphate deacetylase [Mobilitalea sp.]